MKTMLGEKPNDGHDILFSARHGTCFNTRGCGTPRFISLFCSPSTIVWYTPAWHCKSFQSCDVVPGFATLITSSVPRRAKTVPHCPCPLCRSWTFPRSSQTCRDSRAWVLMLETPVRVESWCASREYAVGSRNVSPEVGRLMCWTAILPILRRESMVEICWGNVMWGAKMMLGYDRGDP